MATGQGYLSLNAHGQLGDHVLPVLSLECLSLKFVPYGLGGGGVPLGLLRHPCRSVSALFCRIIFQGPEVSLVAQAFTRLQLCHTHQSQILHLPPDLEDKKGLRAMILLQPAQIITLGLTLYPELPSA